MKIRNVDKNWDWKFGHSTSDYVRDAYAVALDIKMKLQEWYKDCFFALQNGIAWNIRLGSHNQKKLLDADVYRVASEVNGVIKIYNFESSVNAREYKCSFEVYQAYSTESLPISFNSTEINNG